MAPSRDAAESRPNLVAHSEAWRGSWGVSSLTLTVEPNAASKSCVSRRNSLWRMRGLSRRIKPPARLADRVERLVQSVEDLPFSDHRCDPVPPHIRKKVRVDASENDPNVLAGKLYKQSAIGLRRGQSTSPIASASMTSHLTGWATCRPVRGPDR